MAFSSSSPFLILLVVVFSIALVEAGGRQPPCGIRAKKVPNSVDYIVMGGGLAGSVVAGRLSADPSVSVLLIEVGFDASDDPFTQDPTNWATVAGSPLDWRELVALEEPVVFQDLQRRHITSRRTLGGSSAINSAMHYIRSPGTWDHWANYHGLSGWSYKDMLPFFKGIETSDRYATNPAYHGNNRPLRITGTGDLWWPRTVNASINTGLSYNPDWNGAQQLTNSLGVIGFQKRAEVNGVQNACKSFVKPNLCRPNLYVMDKSHTLKVNFDSFKRVRSVTWVDNYVGRTYTTKAHKEVIMSMGTVRTSQIIRLSGVGNAIELQLLGAPLVHNLPGVGQNLQDHPITKINIVSPTGNCGTSDSLKEGHFFLRTELQDPNDPRPNIQALGITDCPSVFSLIYILTPRSRGFVELYSNDRTHRAGVRINFFADPHDLDTIVAGLRKDFNIYKNDPYFNSTCPTFKDINDDAEVKKFIIGTPFVRSNTNSGMHLVGISKIDLVQVVGVSRLRRTSTSIMSAVFSPTSVIVAKAEDSQTLFEIPDLGFVGWVTSVFALAWIGLDSIKSRKLTPSGSTVSDDSSTISPRKEQAKSNHNWIGPRETAYCARCSICRDELTELMKCLGSFKPTTSAADLILTERKV